MIFFFFFQAVDGIRDKLVTGVQTCALPISGATGTVRACLDASVKYARERKTFGQEIGRYQLVQQMIARMSRDYEICRLLYFKVAWMKNKGLRHTRDVSMAKQYATDAAL